MKLTRSRILFGLTLAMTLGFLPRLAVPATTQAANSKQSATSTGNDTTAANASGVSVEAPDLDAGPSIKQQSIPALLGWVAKDNLCGGYYWEPAIVADFPHPAAISQSLTSITATGQVRYSEHGVSLLTGNVVVTQPGRRVTADRALLFRDPKTHQIDRINLFGNVHFREAGKLLIGDRAYIDLQHNTFIIAHALYHNSQVWQTTAVNSWGTAQQIHRTSLNVMDLKDASYSSCAPTSNTWKIKSSKMHLDKNTGRGNARNARIYVKSVPILYTPYFSFPLDNRRKTGFLFPTFQYSQRNGFDTTVPFYWNLAPNYDATITPRYLSKRGWLNNALVRYLTSKDEGWVSASFIPYDQEFANFRDNLAQSYPPSTPFYQETESRLQSDHDYRGFFQYQDTSVLDENWSSFVELNHVTDDYYFEDFGDNPQFVDLDQLLNQAKINYDNEHWHWSTQVQGYQTLHPIDQTQPEDQYQRLPQFDANADYPNEKGGFDYQLSSEFVRFEHDIPFGTTQPVPTGNRVNLDPKISLPFNSAAGFIIPETQLELTDYELRNNTVNDPQNPEDISRAVPIFDIDSGLFFERNLKLLSSNYIQTLEPRLYYLYVPDVNQYNIPLFDTTLPTFSFDELFRTNRFAGIDRIGDANRVAFALTSQLLDGYTSVQKLSASIGALYSFIQPQVNICDTPDCTLPPMHQLSPIVTELTYNLAAHWSATANGAWDLQNKNWENSSINLNYMRDGQHLATIGYNFIKLGDSYTPVDPTIPVTSAKNDLNRINLGLSWPLRYHWSFIGNWNYNISHAYPQAYYYGLQYDSCCFALRFVSSRILLSQQNNGVPGNLSYDKQYFVQLQLKGLGNFGNSSPSGLLQSTLPGYTDPFGGHL